MVKSRARIILAVFISNYSYITSIWRIYFTALPSEMLIPIFATPSRIFLQYSYHIYIRESNVFVLDLFSIHIYQINFSDF